MTRVRALASTCQHHQEETPKVAAAEAGTPNGAAVQSEVAAAAPALPAMSTSPPSGKSSAEAVEVPSGDDDPEDDDDDEVSVTPLQIVSYTRDSCLAQKTRVLFRTGLPSPFRALATAGGLFRMLNLWRGEVGIVADRSYCSVLGVANLRVRSTRGGGGVVTLL